MEKQTVVLRMPKTLVGRTDRYAEIKGFATRTQAVFTLMNQSLDAEEAISEELIKLKKDWLLLSEFIEQSDISVEVATKILDVMADLQAGIVAEISPQGEVVYKQGVKDYD